MFYSQGTHFKLSLAYLCACACICKFDASYFRLNICCSWQDGSNQGNREGKTFLSVYLFMGWQVAFYPLTFPTQLTAPSPHKELKPWLLTVQLAHTSWNTQMSSKWGRSLCSACVMLVDGQRVHGTESRWNLSPFVVVYCSLCALYFMCFYF